MKKIVSSLIACLLIFLSIQPIHAYTNINIELYSQYAYLYDRDTSLVYMEKKSNEKIYPASMTKILTVSLALDYITDLQEVVTIKQADFKGVVEEGATVAGLFPGEKVTYEDLLYGALLPSGADACQALARLIFGDVDHMVTAMNEKVIELGLQQTHFMNVTGLHDEKHYTTAHEMALILNHACLLYTSSLSQEVQNDGNGQIDLESQIPDRKNQMEDMQNSIDLYEAMNHLDEKELQIINERYFKGHTQSEIAKELFISQAQVSRIEKQALSHLKKYMV